MYCSLHLGHSSKTAPRKVEIIHHLFNLIRMADETAAILPFLPSDPVNSICHASHISEKIKDFEHYFPEVKYFHNKIRTKCRFATSIPIYSIKNKIFGELRKYNYWNESTCIKSHETSRYGFFLYAHSDFTHRNDIVEVLEPVFKAHITGGVDFEFDIQPERFKVTAGLNQANERVLMIRSTPSHSEAVQKILITLFSADNNTEIKTLRKYMFVPVSIAGDHDKTTLLGLVRTQHNFRRNVYHYIVINVNDFQRQFQVPIQPETSDTNMTDMTGQDTSDQTGQASSNETDSSSPDQPTDSDPILEPYSLREWLYDMQDDKGEPLIHATYPSADKGKKFVLCEKSKSIQVLQLLHNLIDLTAHVFPDEALTTYFGPNKDLPLVHNHPLTTAELSTYATTLASYATAQNPQDAPTLHQQTQHTQPNQRASKRTRDGEPRTTPQSYATAAGAQASYGVDVQNVLGQLKANLSTLQNVEDKQAAQDSALEHIESRFQQIEGGLRGYGAILKSLPTTQAQQGKLLTNLNNKIDNLTHITTKITGEKIPPPLLMNSLPKIKLVSR